MSARERVSISREEDLPLAMRYKKHVEIVKKTWSFVE
jgi:hypothetical protein